MENDSYKTILKPSEETLFKDRNSKFFGYAFPVLNEEDIKDFLDDLKKKHHTARHFCYAYQLGVEEIKYRANDDGEPNNSAGMPIYGQIQSFEVTNILIVSVRYFGGTKRKIYILFIKKWSYLVSIPFLSEKKKPILFLKFLITCIKLPLKL
jgi:putative IMPACT (imprinted ancient) family translation regulator